MKGVNSFLYDGTHIEEPMKALLSAVIVSFALLLVAPALSFGFSRLQVYADPSLTQCTLTDTSPRIAHIYVAATSYECGTGVRFRVAESAGFTGVWVSEVSPYVPVGNSRTDVAMGFGFALTGQITLLDMTYQLIGTSVCSTISIAPPQGFSVPICTGCIFIELPCTTGEPLHVNCDGSFNCNPLTTESSTWGRVKALYRN